MVLNIKNVSILARERSRCGFIGPSMSGKTYLLTSILKTKYIYDFFGKDNIFLISPTAYELDDSFDDVDLKKENIFGNYSTDTILKIANNYKLLNSQRKKDKKKPVHWLLILDDVVSYLKNNDDKLTDLIFKIRHYYGSVWICSQQYKQLPKPLRMNLSHLFVLVADLNNGDKRDLLDEVNIEKSIFKKIINKYSKEKYNNLYIDNTKKKLYLNLEKEIIIK